MTRQMILNRMITYIQNGTFKPGEKIYSENRLANILGIKRSAVREILVALEIMGILEVRQGEGAYLKAFDNIGQYNPINLLVLLQQGSVEDIMQVRRIIETQVASLCAKNISEEHLLDLERCISIMQTSRDYEVVSRNDIKFHTIMSEATGNVILSLMFNMISGYMNYLSYNNWKSVTTENHRKSKARLIEQHMKILEHLRQKNSEKAYLAMEEHLTYMENDLNKFNTCACFPII